MGELLRNLSQQQRLRIAIDAERFPFPWTLLYDRDTLDLDQIDSEGFWGFRHVVRPIQLANPRQRQARNRLGS
jgi:hypothetical protein